MKRVLCLGSDQAVDCIGWQMAGLLSERVRASAEEYDIRQCATPLELLNLLDGVDALFIVDALKGGKAGDVRAVDWNALVRDHAVSIHGFDLVTLLETAHALGDLPMRCTIIGIGVGATGQKPVTPDPAMVEQVFTLLRTL